ncbi:MAG: hypothetical protein CFE24_06575 [Flavobacterium sp. BFFFF2]|nr:MAG: hypothetical protein CFE24_06575 [Flavobacterium sp. BFFFF2]
MTQTILDDQKGNALRFSGVRQFESKLDFAAFSAKYVVAGSELYQINRRHYRVESGEYITGNASIESNITIDHPSVVKGICVDVSRHFIEEIIAFEFGNNQELTSFILEREGMVNRFNTQHTQLGYAFRQLEQLFTANAPSAANSLNAEIFYTLAECIVKDHSLLFRQFQQLKTVKIETSQRLFDCIHEGRLYIDRHFLKPMNLAEISLQAHVSEYHFIRLFKQVVGVTPYQYLLHNRLQYAYELLIQGQKANAVAELTGFADLASFSKAFKQKFGISPSKA